MLLAKSKHFVWGSILFFACTHKSSQQRFADYVNDPKNKITQTIRIGDVDVVVKWVPPTPNLEVNNADDTKRLRADQDGYCFFNVRFKKRAGENLGKGKAMYLDFDMQNDFTLYCAGDSIKPAICQKIENGMSGNYEYLLAFDRRVTTQNFSLFYKDKIFGIGEVGFVYSQNDIRKIPGI